MKTRIICTLITSCLFLSGMALATDAAATHAPAQRAHHARVASAHGKAASTQPVDINHADATQLSTLKGIGAKKADAVVAYRQAHGAFQTVSDLTKVKGIGAKMLARLQKNNPGRIVLSAGKA